MQCSYYTDNLCLSQKEILALLPIHLRNVSMKKIFLAIALFAAAISQAQVMEYVGYYPAASDRSLISEGRDWYYKAGPSPIPSTLIVRAPKEGAEQSVVDRATSMLNGSSAKAVVLVDGNNIVYQGAKAGVTETAKLNSYSMTKTVTAMAVGKAICAGSLSRDTQAEAVIPQLSGTDLGKATVLDLLRMSSGVWEGNVDASIFSKKQAEGLIDKTVSLLDIISSPKVSTATTRFFQPLKPGELFEYKGTDPVTLGVMIANSTKMPYSEWVDKEIFKPMGMQYGANIPEDHFRNAAADGTIRMPLTDWVRFAVWVRNSADEPGCFGDFVREATQPQIKNNTRANMFMDSYGYLIWTGNRFVKNSYWAVGHGGQRIGWNTKNKRMIIVFSNVENYMDDIYRVYEKWVAVEN
jgi:CubicO group peptidase (beta-lactamase class C family)